MNAHKTTLTLQNCDGTYTIEVPKEDLNIESVVDELIKPVLLAAGYHSKNVEEVFNGESE